MKKTLLMIFSLCFMVILLTGCCSMAAEKEYNIVLLGDIHYDKMEFHQMPPPNVKISWDKGVCDKNGVYLHRLGTKWMTDSCYTTASHTGCSYFSRYLSALFHSLLQHQWSASVKSLSR